MVSLRGAGIANPVVIKAHGVKSEMCDNTEESTTTESDGSFRVRGLKVCNQADSPFQAFCPFGLGVFSMIKLFTIETYEVNMFRAYQ